MRSTSKSFPRGGHKVKKPGTAATAFAAHVTARGDGTPKAVYLSISAERVDRTEEIIRNELLVDLDRNGELVGIEILAPVPLKKIKKLTALPSQKGFRERFGTFITKTIPADLVVS
jgi:uncharacterized protein YuzE